jgi:hypothetical protein
MKIRKTYWLYILFFLCACEKEEGMKQCLVQSIDETTIGYQGRIDGELIKSYTNDKQNRIIQERYTDPSQRDFLVVKSYTYDNTGKLIEIRTEREGFPTYSDNFVYNELGQVTTKYSYLEESSVEPKVELWRNEYTYAAAKELETSKMFYRNELIETSEYSYTNGLMTKVKIQEPRQQYEVDIKYDDKRSPFSESPAILATMLNWGYPHQHNIVSAKGKYADGTDVQSIFYNITYHYSDNGFPISAQQLSVYDSAYDYAKVYKYTCD